jgi:hypothetical protein
MEYISPLNRILDNIESLPVPKFKLFEWVTIKCEQNPSSQDFGIITGYYYDRNYQTYTWFKEDGIDEVMIIYHVVYHDNSPASRIHSGKSDLFAEDEIEKIEPDKI